MEEQELKLLWKAYDRKLEKSLSLNYRNLADIQKMKAQSALQPVKRIKWLAIVLGLLWIAFLGYLTVNFFMVNIFFTVSVGILFVIYTVTVSIYIRHLVLINQFDNSTTVVEGQQKLAALQTSLLWIVRILFLSMPLYATWYITFDWIKNEPQSFWLIQFPVILLLGIIGIWLYKNIDYRNSQKKWFRILFSSAEWTGVVKAMEFLENIKEYKKED